jgi:hypothetical protein
MTAASAVLHVVPETAGPMMVTTGGFAAHGQSKMTRILSCKAAKLAKKSNSFGVKSRT